MTAEETWKDLYNKELNCKKNILEYIEITKVLKKENESIEVITETYNYIYNSIENLRENIKPNTMMYLKNKLKSELGKYVIVKDPKEENHFIKFFKEAYPENNRRKDFTWVLMNLDSITDEQIWVTLAYINRECINNKLVLTKEEKEDIIEVINKLIQRNNIKYINDLKTLKKLIESLGISIVKSGKVYKIKKC